MDNFDVYFGHGHVVLGGIVSIEAAIQILELEMVSNERNVNSTCF